MKREISNKPVQCMLNDQALYPFKVLATSLALRTHLVKGKLRRIFTQHYDYLKIYMNPSHNVVFRGEFDGTIFACFAYFSSSELSKSAIFCLGWPVRASFTQPIFSPFTRCARLNGRGLWSLDFYGDRPVVIG